MLKILIYTFLLTFSVFGHADNFRSLVMREYDKFKNSDDRVMVMFKASGNVNTALENIKSAMRTKDPFGAWNPYWIISFDFEAVSNEKNCGVVFAKWYARNFLSREGWEKIMKSAFASTVEIGAYAYSVKGDFATTDTMMDEVLNRCGSASR